MAEICHHTLQFVVKQHNLTLKALILYNLHLHAKSANVIVNMYPVKHYPHESVKF